MLQKFARRYASLTPKATTKKTKSRHFTFDGIPHVRLPPAYRLSPLHNPKLAANHDLPRRERHFRMCLARAQCATDPLNVDIQHFNLPYWLDTSRKSVTTSSQQDDASSSGGRSAGAKGLGPQSTAWEPVIQKVGGTRLSRANVASAQPEERARWTHAGVLAPEDLAQVEQVKERQQQYSKDLAKVPLFDRVTIECKEALSGQKKEIEPMQHGIARTEFESLLGTAVHDAGRAILKGQDTVKIDMARDTVEKIVGLSTSNAAQINKYETAQVLEAFKTHPTDCGSTQVTCALLTLRIRKLAQHVYNFPQDTEARVQLENLTHRRRRDLKYFKNVNFDAYMNLCRDLALKFA